MILWIHFCQEYLGYTRKCETGSHTDPLMTDKCIICLICRFQDVVCTKRHYWRKLKATEMTDFAQLCNVVILILYLFLKCSVFMHNNMSRQTLYFICVWSILCMTERFVICFVKCVQWHNRFCCDLMCHHLQFTALYKIISFSFYIWQLAWHQSAWH